MQITNNLSEIGLENKSICNNLSSNGSFGVQYMHGLKNVFMIM